MLVRWCKLKVERLGILWQKCVGIEPLENLGRIRKKEREKNWGGEKAFCSLPP